MNNINRGFNTDSNTGFSSDSRNGFNRRSNFSTDTVFKTTKNNGSNLNSNPNPKFLETNTELIKYIYSVVDVAQLKFEILKYENQLSKFVSGGYFVSPNYYGRNCFLVFTKLKSKYYSFMVDRRQLSYTLDKVRMEEVFINHCNVDVDLPIYNGTVLDGVYVKQGNTHEFIVTDVYVFKGTDYTHNRLNHKLFELEMYLNNINSQNRMIDRINSKLNLDLKINKVVKLTEIKNYLSSAFADLSKQYQIRGICFYPELSGTKLIHLFENNSDKTDSDNYPPVNGYPNSSSFQSTNTNNHSNPTNYSSNSRDEHLQKSKNIVKRVFVAKTDEPIYAVLEMQSTKIADNYKLYALEQVKDGTNTRLKKCPMDIAYIPNMEKSQWCRNITTSSAKGSVFVKCIWRDDKRKWEPIEQTVNVKLPTLIDDIRLNIVELEQQDSDTDEE